MMIPEYVWIAVTIFLAVCILYVAQRIVMNDQLASILSTSLKSILDINKEKTTSEEDEDLDSSDDPNLDDFLD